MSEGTSRKILR